MRRYDPATCQIDLDFVLHDGGVASAWADAAAVGDQVTIAGPPGAKAFPHSYDHYVFAVDATALPAVARWLEESPADVSAHVVAEVDDPAERDYPLAARDGVAVTWLVRGRPGPRSRSRWDRCACRPGGRSSSRRARRTTSGRCGPGAPGASTR
ncbi:siderophore-interacting protein [Micromonospora sp. BRA006-A]|nr:siderophore-interacting protein [Micromonospora sp. BRA006-A]